MFNFRTSWNSLQTCARHRMSREAGRKSRRLPRVTRLMQPRKKARRKNITRASRIHFRYSRRAKASAVAMPMQHRSVRPFCQTKQTGMMRHPFDSFQIAINILD